MDHNGPLQARRSRKIGRQEWATIKSRHATGESLARIARAYQCTAPAIRCIVRQEAQLDPSASPPKDEERPPPAARKPAGDNAGQPQAAAAPGSRMARFNPELREVMGAQIAHFPCCVRRGAGFTGRREMRPASRCGRSADTGGCAHQDRAGVRVRLVSPGATPTRPRRRGGNGEPAVGHGHRVPGAWKATVCGGGSRCVAPCRLH